MNKKTDGELYDISKYTDIELYDILDVINPSDRELEAKILFLHHKYKNMQNESGNQLAKFFEDIYDRFFEHPEEPFHQVTQQEEAQEVMQEGFQQVTPQASQQEVVQQQATQQVTQQATQEEVAQQSTKNDTSYTKPLDYVEDKLNPLLQQTIKRVISIDSQYRDNKNALSTEFTFNLSDPLKDVVSLKLYSIQIPYTWYTINNNFGSNFFYLKGNSPGINDGNYDYKIDISAGNYSPANLVTALNQSFQKVIANFTDVSFGTTKISYNENTSLCTLTIDINKLFNETSYYLDFPYATNPNGDQSVGGPRYDSIPGFLGYNYQTYYPNVLNSNKTLPLTTNTNSATQDNISGVYYVDESNNYITIVKYIGPSEYSTKSTVDLSFNIYLSISGVATRTQIVNDLSAQLANNTYLSNSEITRIDIVDPSLNNYGNSYFQLTIKFNRLTTNNTKNSKIYVLFPTETTTNYNSVWTGGNSCFRFESIGNELNNILSETAPVQQQSGKYVILNNPYIYLKSTKTGYDVSSNDYKITLANSSTLGYALSEYINAINTSLNQTNNTTKTAKNTLGDFNMTNTVAEIDKTSFFNLNLDINKKFNQDSYVIDLSGSVLKNLLKLGGSYLNGNLDLSGNPSSNNFTSSFQQNVRYTIDSSFLLIARPSQNNYGNQNSGNIVVPFIKTNAADTLKTYYSSFTLLQQDINNSFNTYADADGTNIFSGTNVTLSNNPTNPDLINSSFTIAMQKILTQKNYKIGFYDASAVDINDSITKTSSSWFQNLNVDASYLITDLAVTGGKELSSIYTNGSTISFTTIKGTSAITVNTITFTEGVNNFFYVKPYDAGVYAANGENDIKITIPANVAYTRDTLITTINGLLTQNSYTTGTSIQVITLNNVEYTKLRININKLYSASDYNLVFYDQYSFVKCYSGVSSVRNTTWDTTLGWILGYRNSTIYNLSNYGTTGNIITLTGDTTVSVNLFNYFLICLDDFNQNHLNDGLVTLTSIDTDIPLPSYANRANYNCDPVTGLLSYNTETPTTASGYSKLTQNQLYSLTQIANSKRVSSIISRSENISSKSYGSGPFVKDVFGLIPMKTSGLANGSVYVEFGGTLQNQERTYFGPVNIQRMSVKLVSDRGDIVDLNGSNWSFSLICEQLYQQNPMSTTAAKTKK